MAESSLSIGYVEFRREAGKFLGYDPTTDNWSTAQADDVTSIIDAGYRQVLFPPILPNDRAPHRWAFLRPMGALTTVAEQGDYSLPDDFDGLDGPIRPNDYSSYTRIQLTTRDHVLSMRQTNAQGIPILAAVTPRISNGIQTARWDLMFWPTPAGAYGYTYRYKSIPSALSEAQPYPVGGVGFGELVMESILSICEERKNDAQGIHRNKFIERLAAAIMDDRATKSPDSFGMMTDPSTSPYDRTLTRRDWSGQAVTYLGSSD